MSEGHVTCDGIGKCSGVGNDGLLLMICTWSVFNQRIDLDMPAVTLPAIAKNVCMLYSKEWIAARPSRYRTQS